MRLLAAVVVFFAVDEAGALLDAVDLAAVDFAAVDLATGLVVVVLDFVALLRFEGDPAVVDRDAAVLLVAVFVAAPLVVFFAAGELVEADFAALDRGVVVFAVLARLLVALLVEALPVVALVAVERPAAALADGTALTVDTFGSFFSPDISFFRSAPALNFGTAVFFARLRSPVRGLRTIRDGRAIFSKAPKPVIATFSPLTSSRSITSMTESSA